MNTYTSGSGIFIEIPNPIYTSLVRSPTVIGYNDNPIGRESAIFVLGREIIFTRNNHKRRYYLTSRANALDYYNPFPITRLDLLSPPTAFGRGNNKGRRDLAY